jgi:hypothetical protein
MGVLGHDHVSDHGKTIALAHPLEDNKEQIPARGGGEQRLTAVAAPGDGMQASRAVSNALIPQGMK